MTAKSHGLEEFAKTLETTLIESEEYDHERIFREAEKYVGPHKQKAKALLPLRPVFVKDESLSCSNWPMVNLRAKDAERAAQMFKRQKAELAENDDMFFDAKEYHTSNQNVANILSQDTSAKVQEGEQKTES